MRLPYRQRASQKRQSIAVLAHRPMQHSKVVEAGGSVRVVGPKVRLACLQRTGRCGNLRQARLLAGREASVEVGPRGQSWSLGHQTCAALEAARLPSAALTHTLTCGHTAARELDPERREKANGGQHRSSPPRQACPSHPGQSASCEDSHRRRRVESSVNFRAGGSKSDVKPAHQSAAGHTITTHQKETLFSQHHAFAERGSGP